MPQIWIELGMNKLIGKESISNGTTGRKKKDWKNSKEKRNVKRDRHENEENKGMEWKPKVGGTRNEMESKGNKSLSKDKTHLIVN